jgi:chromosome segregation ATPase
MLVAKNEKDITKHNAHINRLLREIAVLKEKLTEVTRQRDVLEERITERNNYVQYLLREKKNANDPND